MPSVKTKRVKFKAGKFKDVMTINADSFDPALHEEVAPPKAKPPKAKGK